MKRRLISLILCALMLLPLAGCASDARKEGAGRMDITDFTPGEIVTKAPETTEPVPEIHKRISLAAVGDDIIYQAGFTDAKKRADDGRDYNFLPNYENIRDAISSADIAFVNQETLMAGKEYGYSDYPRFNSPQSLLDDLITVGFDVISIANNHMLDMGTPGLADTIAYYKTKSDSVTMIGGYDNEEDFMTPRVVERDGIKIAFVAFTYATNGLKLKQGSEIYVPYIDDNDIVRAIEAGKQAADIVILSMHWGIENNFTPSDDQRRVAQLAADAGAFAIIGHHPHVIQPVEWFTGRSGNKMLCIFSLGDLIAVMMKSHNMLSGLVTFDIVQDNDEFHIENTLFTPLVFHFGPSYYNGKIYYLKDFTKDLESTFGNVYGIKDGKDRLESLVKRYIDAEFLPDYLKDEPDTEG